MFIYKWLGGYNNWLIKFKVGVVNWFLKFVKEIYLDIIYVYDSIGCEVFYEIIFLFLYV